jgi:hypothetical protein
VDSSLTISLIPAFSPRRRRMLRRPDQIPATELVEPSPAKAKMDQACSFSSGEKAGMRAGVSPLCANPGAWFQLALAAKLCETTAATA